MNEKIILVEDDIEIKEIYKMKLTLSSYDVITVEDGALAIPKIKIELPDMILLDILLPHKDGFDILKDLKSEKDEKIKSIPVFMLTNLSNEQDIKEALRLGATDYIVKAKNSPENIVSKIKTFFENQKKNK